MVVLVYTLLWPFTGRERRRVVLNAVKVLGMTEEAARSFAKEVLCSQSVIYLETIKYVFYPERITVEGLEPFQQTMRDIEASGRGQVVITAHLGAWELAGHFCAVAFKKPFHVLAKPSKTKWVNPVLNRIREMLNMKVLWIDAKSLFRDMLKALDHGETVGFVMDQKPAFKQGGHLVTFMGIPDTAIVTGPALVITKKNVPAVGAYCLRIGPCRYKLIATDILKAQHGEFSGEDVSKRLAADMERMIRQFPRQWAWNYKRWRF